MKNVAIQPKCLEVIELSDGRNGHWTREAVPRQPKLLEAREVANAMNGPRQLIGTHAKLLQTHEVEAQSRRNVASQGVEAQAQRFEMIEGAQR